MPHPCTQWHTAHRLMIRKKNMCFCFLIFLFCLQAGESSGLFRKTISKLRTEYQIQFIWPYTRKDRKRSDDDVDAPKKSLSMGAIKSQAQSYLIPAVHKKRSTHEKEGVTTRRICILFASFSLWTFHLTFISFWILLNFIVFSSILFVFDFFSLCVWVRKLNETEFYQTDLLFPTQSNEHRKSNWWNWMTN